MCGICGKISLERDRVSQDLITAMMGALAHRGPDDAGQYKKAIPTGRGAEITVGLGHRRLSIIDLSPDGRQPMTNEDGSIWVVFNGEIYNHQALRQELIIRGHRFRSRADTEVLLHLYEDKGIDALRQVNGMFAVAIWDEPRRRLYLCRDRLGIKPLVYYYDQTSLVFASEIRALLQDAAVPREIDWQALVLYLTFNYIPAPFTIYRGVQKILPGYYLCWDEGKTFIRQYWDIPRDSGATARRDIGDLSHELRDVLEDAVQLQMVADVPLGVFLSGGLDSSIIAALMARSSPAPIKTFTIAYPDQPLYDETRYARALAEMYGTEHHEIRLDSGEMLRVIPDILSSLGEPFGDSSLIPTSVVSRETRGEVTVALAGDGGDELFAGYRLYQGEALYPYYRRLPRWFRRYALESWIDRLPDSRKVKWLEHLRRLKKFFRGTHDDPIQRLLAWREVFSPELLRSLLNGNRSEASPQSGENWLRELDRWPADDLNRLLYLEVKDSLPSDMLTKVDLMSMREGLEVRVPYLDHRLVELAFHIPGSMKLHRLQRKYILRETFKDLLPPSLHRRPKQGFEVPISVWLEGDLRYLLDEYLSPDVLRKQGIFNQSVVKELKTAHRENRRDTSWLLWNLIVFQCWYSTNVDTLS
jgi:asparagine synthase (glutamine-hydrolysing)